MTIVTLGPRKTPNFHPNQRTTSLTHKICRDCNIEKEISEFYKKGNSGDGYEYRCTPCYHVKKIPKKERLKQEYPQDKSKCRNIYFKSRYGTTLEIYNEMLLAQEGKCYICGKLPRRRSLAVDHCHKTGTVRKLLCSNYNTAIGLLDEDVEKIDRVLGYIQLHRLSIEE